MRYYRIVITDPQSGQVVEPPGFEGLLDGATYASYVNGQSLPGAWNVELDIPVGPSAAPLGGAHVRVWGISLQEIAQANDLKNKNIAVYGGMQRGLPLANPRQSGLLAKGFIFQAFGNWINTDQTLDLIIMPGDAPTSSSAGGTGSPAAPINLSLNWRSGTPLSQALTTALQAAFPGRKINVAISDKLVANGDQVGFYSTLPSLAQYAKAASKGVIRDDGYAGVEIFVGADSVEVYDGTQASTDAQPVAIDYVDLIGQPTWIESPLIQVKTVMRADLRIGGEMTLPQTVVTNTAAAQSSLVNQRLAFQGGFLVQQMRHIGNFRQGDAASWVTVVNGAPKKLEAAGG